MDKKKLLIVIVALVLLILIIGYIMLKRGSGGTTNSQVELTYWGLWEKPEHMEEVIAAFEKDNPNIKINYTQKRFTQYEDNLYGALDDPQTTPDIVRVNNAWTYKFQSKLSRVPPEIMSESTYKQTFYSAAANDFEGNDGYLYAIPLEIDGLSMYYNVDLFTQAGISQPPEDWDTLIEQAKVLTEKNTSGEITQAGAGIGCSNNVLHSADILTALMLLNNVTMNNEDGTQAAFNTTNGQNALEYYTDFVTIHKVWDCTLRSDLEMFASGKLAIMFGPSWRVFDIIDMNSALNFKTVPFPQLSGNPDELYYGMYWGEAVSAASSHQLEAWTFIKFLSESDQLMTMYSAESNSRSFGEPYSRKDLAEEISGSGYVGAFIQMAPFYVSWRIGDQKTSEAALNKAIADVVEGRASTGTALEEAQTTANDKMNDIYSGQTQL
jgi:multiple sugar transport system substrate-binding protein